MTRQIHPTIELGLVQNREETPVPRLLREIRGVLSKDMGAVSHAVHYLHDIIADLETHHSAGNSREAGTLAHNTYVKLREHLLGYEGNIPLALALVPAKFRSISMYSNLYS